MRNGVCSAELIASAGKALGRAWGDPGVWTHARIHCQNTPPGETFRPSFFPESTLPWLCGCFWNLSKQKPPGCYWPSLEVELCPLFSEFSMIALSFQLLCNSEIPIITEGRADLFSLLLCHPIVRMAPPFLQASRTREMICSFENPSGGVPYADEKVGRELTAGEHLFCAVPTLMCASHWSMPSSPEQGGVLVCRVKMAQRGIAGGHWACRESIGMVTLCTSG